MIIKSFELNKINQKNINYYLFYGENEGHKTDSINNIFNIKSLENIYRFSFMPFVFAIKKIVTSIFLINLI